MDITDLRWLSSRLLTYENSNDKYFYNMKIRGSSNYTIIEVATMYSGTKRNLIPYKSLWLVSKEFMRNTGVDLNRRLTNVEFQGTIHLRNELEFEGMSMISSMFFDEQEFNDYTCNFDIVISKSPCSKSLSLLFMKYKSIYIIHRKCDTWHIPT